MQHIDLSLAQIRVLDVYRDVIQSEQRPPTYAEVARRLSVTVNAIWKAVRILEKKGYLVRRPGVRNVVLTDKAA